MAYWRRGQLILENYAGSIAIESGPLVLDVLDRFSTWTPIEHVTSQLPHVPVALLRRLVDALIEHGALEREPRNRPARTSTPKPARSNPWDSWTEWSPAATFFHHSTKDVAFTDRADTNRRLKARATADPIPPALKAPRRTRQIALPPPRVNNEAPATPVGTMGARVSAIPAFPDVLLSRRTWRRFGTRSLRRDELSTLLGLTWGVQAWMDVDGWGRMALKTAPSGGARHSIEAYVLVRRVEGLAPGLYHYRPAAHRLQVIRPLTAAAARAALRAYLPRQAFYGEASALILMTSVFARVQWRYAFARAYRTILAEAGHHAQNFCLVATWLGLAPFCTMALADSRIERDLEIDGISESVLYAVGAGPRPPDTDWAPWPRPGETPARTAHPLGKPRRR